MKSIAGLATFAGFLYMALVVPLVDAGFIELTVEDKTNQIEFNGMLRYKIELGPHLEFEYRHCYLNSASIPKFKPGVGSWGVCDPAIKNRPGLYFPDGYNSSTVIRAYDSYISRFYDCARTDSSQDGINNTWTTYSCGPIPVAFEGGVPPPPPSPPVIPKCPHNPFVDIARDVIRWGVILAGGYLIIGWTVLLVAGCCAVRLLPSTFPDLRERS